MKMIWFEDMKKDMMKAIREISKFIGYDLTEQKVLELDDHLNIDNFRQVMVENTGDNE